MEQVSKKLFKGAIWLALARFLINCLGLLSTFVLARLLTPSDFGMVAIATSILAVALSVTDLSLASALVQRTDLAEEHFHSVWTISLLRSLAIFVVIALAAYPLARLYGDPRLTAVLVAVGFTAALPGLSSPKMIAMTRNLVFWQDFAVQTVQRLLAFVGAVGCAIVYQSYWALIVGNLIGALASVVLSYLISPYLPRVSLSKFKELFAYSSWLSMGNIVNTFNYKFDQLVLGYLVGKAPLGIYTVADNIAALPVREATMPLAKTLFPAFSRIAHDPERLRRAYLRSQSLICAVAMPVGFGFAAVADPVVHLFLGQKWLGAAPIIQILSATFALQALSTGLQPLAMSKGATKVLFGRDVRTFLIRIPFIVAGYLWDGLLGVVIARAVSSLIGMVWNMGLVAELSGISIGRQFRNCSRSLLATTFMVIATMIAQRLMGSADGPIRSTASLALSIGVGTVSYMGASALLWMLAGRLRGPETEVVTIVSGLLAMFSTRLQSSHRK